MHFNIFGVKFYECKKMSLLKILSLLIYFLLLLFTNVNHFFCFHVRVTHGYLYVRITHDYLYVRVTHDYLYVLRTKIIFI